MKEGSAAQDPAWGMGIAAAACTLWVSTLAYTLMDKLGEDHWEDLSVSSVIVMAMERFLHVSARTSRSPSVRYTRNTQLG